MSIKSLLSAEKPEALAIEMLERARAPGAKAAFAVVLRDDPETGEEMLWMEGVGIEAQVLLWALAKVQFEVLTQD